MYVQASLRVAIAAPFSESLPREVSDERVMVINKKILNCLSFNTLIIQCIFQFTVIYNNYYCKQTSY